MPRKPRVDLAGYHHIINRGVNRSEVFVDDDDYEMFLKIVCKACRAYRVILHDCALHSKLIEELDYENVQEIIGIRLNEEDLEIVEKIKNQKIIVKDKTHKIAFSKTLDEHFREAKTIKERNEAMAHALEDGYTQIALANYLNVSRSLVSKVLKGRV